MKKIKILFLIFLLTLLSSCGVFKKHYVNLKANIDHKHENFGHRKKIKISVNSLDHNQNYLGNRAYPNGDVAENLGVYSIGSFEDVFEKELEKFFLSKNFKMTKTNNFYRYVDVDVGYFKYQNDNTNGAQQLDTNIAVKITIKNNKGKEIYSDWIFYTEPYIKGWIHNLENNSNSVNLAMNNFLKNLFSNENLINNLK